MDDTIHGLEHELDLKLEVSKAGCSDPGRASASIIETAQALIQAYANRGRALAAELEEERKETARLRAKCEETTCPACHRARPNEQDWRDGVCDQCFSAGLTVPS